MEGIFSDLVEDERIQQATAANTAESFALGGTLLIGVADDGSVHRLELDYATLREAGKADADSFELHLNQIVINAVGEAAAANVSSEVLTVDGKDLCRVHVQPSKFPVEASVTYVVRGQHEQRKEFFFRFGNQSKAIKDPGEVEKLEQQMWG